MQNYEKKLSLSELNQCMQMLNDKYSSKGKNNDIYRRTLSDINGNQYDLGGTSNRIIIDENEIPNVVAEERGMILSCGHSINSSNEILGRCSFGHILCKEHQFYICTHKNCRRILCDLEVIYDEENKPTCPDHNSTNWWEFIVIGSLIIITFFYIISLLN